MYSEQNRAFNYAVLASIVLHAMLLFGVSLRERPRPAEPQVAILARLVEPPVPAPAAAPAPPPQAEAVKPKPRAKPVAPRPVAKKEPAPQPEPAPEPAAEEPVVAQVESVAPAPAAPPVVASTDPAPATKQIEDPGSLAQYRLQVVAAAPKFKRYPRVARDNNWEGFVAVRMVVGPSGRVASIAVTKTSGYDVLDEQAMEMFRSAAAAVPVPPVLRGKEFAVEVAATYYFTD
jgi:periplasmic protein TonB